MSVFQAEVLSVRYRDTEVLGAIDLRVERGEVMALLGPSGSGKSTLALAALGLLPAEATVSGIVRVHGRAAMIFQDPATALNPALTIGRQIAEVPALAAGVPRSRRKAAVERLLERVGLAVPPDRYPHQLSGGQRQRVVVAMALAARPTLLIADEPTAALDPVAARDIAALLLTVAREEGMGLLFVTHDRAMAARADRAAVLGGGRVVDEGPAGEVVGRLGEADTAAPPAVVSHDAVLRADGVGFRYAGAPGWAVQDMTIAVGRGETVALAGASGSGKSTLARLLLGLARPAEGRVSRAGRAFAVFQDPATSMDPRWTVRRIVDEPLHGAGLDRTERAQRVAAAIAAVELPAGSSERRPAELSGGQRQRVALARALVVAPSLIVLDEALSALDEDLAARMINLLLRLQREQGISYVLISHDMAVIRRMAHRLVVLAGGRVVDEGDAAALLDTSSHPLTTALARG